MKTKTTRFHLEFALRHLFGAVLFCIGQNAWAVNWWDTISDAGLRQCVSELATQRNWQQASDADEIVCHAKGIRDLTGLAGLPHVTKLSLYNNQLTTIRLSDWPKLKHLNVARNRLQSLQISNTPQLAELLCFDNTLNQFELSNQPALQLLKCNANKMVKFDYVQLPLLEKVYLFNNQLPTIDVDHLPSLRYMDVRQNPMPDELYQRMDKQKNVTYLHDGNAPDWK